MRKGHDVLPRSRAMGGQVQYSLETGGKGKRPPHGGVAVVLSKTRREAGEVGCSAPAIEYRSPKMLTPEALRLAARKAEKDAQLASEQKARWRAERGAAEVAKPVLCCKIPLPQARPASPF